MSGDGTLKDSNYGAYFADTDARDPGSFSGTTKDGSPVEGAYIGASDDGDTYTYTGSWADEAWNGYGEYVPDDSKYLNMMGNFEDGVFKPSKSEWITSLGTYYDCSYTVSDANKEFVDNNDGLFPYTSDPNIDLNSFINSDITYSAYIKNPEAFSGALMRSTLQNVVQINETNDPYIPGGVSTTMITHDNSTYDDVYYVYYIGR